jgi:hypothetical protein
MRLIAMQNEEEPKKRGDEHLSAEKRKQLWLHRILYNWSLWKKTGGMGHFHVRAGSVGECFTHYGETDYDKHDRQMGQIVDAVVRDLKPIERDAIEHEYLERMWSHSLDIHRVLVIAHEAVRMGLARKGFTCS